MENFDGYDQDPCTIHELFSFCYILKWNRLTTILDVVFVYVFINFEY